MQIMMHKDHDFGLHQRMRPLSYTFYHAARSARGRLMVQLLARFVAVTLRRFHKNALFVAGRRRGDVGPRFDSQALRELALRRHR
jgi:hypothetical protein